MNVNDNPNVFRLVYPDGKVKAFDDSASAMREYSKLADAAGGYPELMASGGRLVGAGQTLENGELVTYKPTTKAAPKKEKVEPVTTDEPLVELRTKSGTISKAAKERIARHQAELEANGLTLPPPVYAPGTVVVGLGVDNFRLSRKEWEDSPPLEEALAQVASAVAKEGREDATLPLSALSMDEHGVLHAPDLLGPEGARLEPGGFDQLIYKLKDIFPRGRSMMLAMDKDLRAEVFNRQIAKMKEHEITLRVRNNEVSNSRSVYSVVSPGYTVYNIDRLATEMMLAVQGKGLRGEVYYDPTTTRFKAQGWYHANKVVDLAAGDVFKVGVTMTSTDNGTGGFNIYANAIRNLCLNLIILGYGRKDLLNKRHRGDKSNLTVDIQAAIEQGAAMFEPFAKEWGALHNTPIEKLYPDTNWDAIFEEVVSEMKLPGKSKVQQQLLLDAWDAEPGENGTSLINAITRLHESPLVDEFGRELVEAYASTKATQLAAKAMELT